MSGWARTTIYTSILAAAAASFGCGGEAGPATVPVSGTVTLNEQPLGGAEVTYTTENFSSFGKTGPDGRYTLVQGAPPGKNTVSITKWEGDKLELNPEEGIDEGQLWSEADAAGIDASALNIPRQLVPADYQNLDYVVPEGGTETADFRLTGN